MRAFRQYSKSGLSLDEVRDLLIEHFDLHDFKMLRVKNGVVLTADRYGYRVSRELTEVMLEDSIMHPHVLLSCVIDEMASWLRALPILNHDPGDEDRR